MSFSNAAETAINDNIFVGTALPWDANTATTAPGTFGERVQKLITLAKYLGLK